MSPKRGEIWTVNLNPGYKSEPGKTRPALVIQNNAIDCGSYIVIPISSVEKEGIKNLQHKIKARDNLKKDSVLILPAVRSVDAARFKEGPLTKLENDEMDEVLKKLTKIIS